MPLTYDDWLTTQDADTIAAGMGLPPLTDAGRDVLAVGHRIGQSAADRAATPQEARRLIHGEVAELMSSTPEGVNGLMANAVGLGRSTWLTPMMVFETGTPSAALIPFLERVAYRTAITKFALNPESGGHSVPIMSESTVGTMQVSMPTPPPVGVEVTMGDILARPRGRHALEGSLGLNEKSIGWVFSAPFSMCTTSTTKIAQIVDPDGLDAEAAASMIEWVTTQIDLLAHGAAAQLA